MSEHVRAILNDAGITEQVDFVRASGGQRNETWLCGRYVIRLNHDPNVGFLAREANVLQQIADSVPVPTVIAHGRNENGEWMIQKKVNGVPLAHVWGTLAEPVRHAAVNQLAEIIQTLHQTPCDRLSPLSLPENWLTEVLPKAVQQLAEQSRLLDHVDPALMDRVVDLSQELADINLSAATWGLIHGDLHFDNLLWDGKQITTLLDFEKACYAPLTLELDLFLRYCTFPALFVMEEFEHLTQSRDYQQVPFWFQQAYPQLFRSPAVREQLELYSLHYDLCLLQAFPPRGPVDPNEEDHLLNRIRAIVEQRSYLSEMDRAISKNK